MDNNKRCFQAGNEIQVRWPILTNGQEESLTNRDLHVFLERGTGARCTREIKTFGREDNVIVFTLPGTDTTVPGVYNLILFENKGRAHQYVTDWMGAFKIVAHSNELPSDISPDELDLSSSNIIVGIRGESAYEIAVKYGYEGSEEQWMEEFNTVLNSTQLIAEKVEHADMVLQRTEELMDEVRPIAGQEQGRIESEQQRVEAESARNESEQTREVKEAERNANEEARQEAEQQRQDAFGASENSRTALFEQHEEERGTAFSQSEQQRQQAFLQSEQQRQQTADESESQRQTDFNTAEDSREQTFESNESNRESRLSEVIADVQNAEAQRQENESDRQVAETERSDSESTRRLNENTRQASETNRNSNESYRRQQETLRVNAENERIQNELLRQSAEGLRSEQDNAIAEAERLRVAVEQQRVVAETGRSNAEQTRARAEIQRAEAELLREQNTTNAINGIEAEIQSKHDEYSQTINSAVSQAQSDVQTAINDWNRTRRVEQTESEVAIQPNVKNIWSSPMQELTITFVAGAAGYDNEYMIQFQCPSDSVTALALPSSVKWMNDEPIELQEGCIYQISIIDNLAIYAEWEAANV